MPSPEELAARRSRLSPGQRAKLEEWRRGGPAGTPGLAAACRTIPRRTGEGPWPLSFSQQRLWILDRLTPDNPWYNLPTALCLRGDLDVPALIRAFSEMVGRHEVLRTVFQAGPDGQPVQVVRPPVPLTVPVVDLGGLPAGEREEEARRLMEEEARQVFSLESGPLMRLRLLRLGEAEHILCLVVHHIAADGWSWAVIVRELSQLYSAFVSGRPLPLPELPIQYADFACWQRQWVKAGNIESQAAYWRERLAGTLPILSLPSDRPRPSAESFRGAIRTRSVPDALRREVSVLARALETTPFTVLLAVFKALLHRYTGQTDILIGSPVANRNRPEVEGLIGFFVNTLVLRTDLSGHPSFRELVARVRETTLGAYEAQDVPFERLVEDLSPERNLSGSPLFQVMFSAQNTTGQTLDLPGLAVTTIPVDPGVSKFDLSLYLVDDGRDLVADLEYSADLFDQATADRILDHYLTLLDGAVRQPDLGLHRLPLMGEAERRRVLVEWNGPADEPLADRLIHQVFERQAALTPEAVAVSQVPGEGGGASRWQSLTYRELDARANQLARHLSRLGVEGESLVGLALERGPELVVGLLGILKAGLAYVPCDLAYPPERLALMLEDARVSCLITREGWLTANAPTVCLDRDWEIIARESESLPDQAAGSKSDPDALAYVIFTSGSTGRPKGVACTHRGVLNVLADFNRRQPPEPGWIWSDWTSLSFDVSVYEIFAPLLSGGELRFPPEAVRADATAFAAWLESNRVESAYIPLFMLGPIADKLRLGQLSLPLRRLTVGVEPIAEDVLTDIARSIPGLVVINGYGPTEATIFVTLYTVPTGADASPPAQPGRRTSIGRAVLGSQVYVLDANMEPVPVGVAGELYAGGESVARGYVGRPDLTADRFPPDPFSAQPGLRLYRTGDLVRLQPDGNIEFIGRQDYQVKVRGFRVELEEIEITLASHPNLRAAVVVAGGTTPDGARLVAYVVADPTSSPTPTELRGFLKEKLPEYMIPSIFITLETLPLTPTGKLDRRALPKPEAALDVAKTREFVPPRTSTEETLARIWADILGLARVGSGDDFFVSGGHSLLAIRVLTLVRQALGVDLPLREMFERPVLSELAARLDAVLGKPAPGSILPRPRAGEPLPLSFAQNRLWFVDQMTPGASVYNIPCLLRLDGELDVAALGRSLGEIVRRHEALRTTFTSAEGHPAQVIGPAGASPPRLLDLTSWPAEAREAEAGRLCREESREPFDLSTGPLFRATLIRVEPARHLLLLVMHHIVSDGWSMSILVRELRSLYGAFRAGRASPLPELPVQYADYAAWQREWLSGGTLEAQVAYWKGKLGGLPPVLELPTDRRRPPIQTFRGDYVSVVAPADLTARLSTLAQRQGVTLFMLLLAAFQVLLRRYAGQDDIWVGTPVANRTRAEIENLIGFFVNTIVLRTDLSGDPTFLELLARVKEVALEAYSGQEAPFERLVEVLEPERNLSHHPIYQVIFSVNRAEADPGGGIGSLGLPGLDVFPVEVHTGTAKFDLTLEVTMAKSGTMTVTAEYSTDLWDLATVSRLVGHYLTLLEGIVVRPEARLSELPLLTEPQRKQIIKEWNDSRRDYPGHRSIHEIFEEQAALSPEAVAVSLGGETLTYGELDRRGNLLAHHLHRLGAGPEVLVGILMERSLEMIVGLIGILKSGSAYLPLDPAYPQERLQFMLEDARAPLLLASEGLLGRLPALPELGTRVVAIDRDWPEIAGESGESGESGGSLGAAGASADNLAYVVYTSGSTGRPKGVAVPHQAVVRLVKNTNFARLAADEIFLQFAPISFDASTLEIWGPLLNGGRLVIQPPGAPSLAELGETVCREGVTTLWLTTGLFNLMVEEHIEALRGLRQLLFGGERASATHVHKAARELEGCRLIHGYGPTENTTFTTCYQVSLAGMAADPGPEARVPIGGPVANTTVYILDRNLRPVPVGAPGELYTGGDGLARGYLNRPELTAERFGPDPFADRPGGRLYRTGDLARYLPDGNIEYLERLDNQVKVRGFRIELGEIETALRAHPGVHDAVVLAREDRPGGRYVVAYLALSPGAQEACGDMAGQLRSFLAQRLPDWMIPSVFVVLPALPLGPTGKVDRQALPAPDAGDLVDGAGYLAPRDDLEAKLVAIWEELLGVRPIGVRDNFFELGGHSLLAAKLIDRVRGLAPGKVPLTALFQEPTVERLATVLRQAGAPGAPEAGSPPAKAAGLAATPGVAPPPAGTWSPLVGLRTSGPKPPLFCIHAAGGLVFYYAEFARRLDRDRPLWGLVSRGVYDNGEIATDIPGMARTYLEAIKIIQPAGPYHLAGYCMGGVVAYEMAQQLRAQGLGVETLTLIDTRAPTPADVPPEEPGWAIYAWELVHRGLQPPAIVDILAGLGHDDARLAALVELARAGRVLPPGIATVPEMARWLEVYRANARAFFSYRPAVYPGRVILLAAAEQPPEFPADLGWGELAGEGLDLRVVPGDHFTIMEAPGAIALAGEMAQILG